MKFSKLYIALLIFLSACNSATPVPTQTAVASTVTVIASPSPSPTPTETQIPQPSDVKVGEIFSGCPDCGPKPDGATAIAVDPGTNKDEWTIQGKENGKDVLYYWTQVPTQERNGWFFVAGQSNLVDQNGLGNTMHANIMCEANTGCPAIVHPKTPDNVTGVTFSNALTGAVQTRFFGKPFQFIDNSYDLAKKRFNNDKVNQYWNDWNSGNVKINWTDARGAKWTYNTGASINIYYAAIPLQNPNYQRNDISFSVVGDESNNINVVTTSTTPMSSLDDQGVADRIFLGAFAPFFVKEDIPLTTEAVLNTIYNANYDTVLVYTIKGPTPFFVITR